MSDQNDLAIMTVIDNILSCGAAIHINRGWGAGADLHYHVMVATIKDGDRIENHDKELFNALHGAYEGLQKLDDVKE